MGSVAACVSTSGSLLLCVLQNVLPIRLVFFYTIQAFWFCWYNQFHNCTSILVHFDELNFGNSTYVHIFNCTPFGDLLVFSVLGFSFYIRGFFGEED